MIRKKKKVTERELAAEIQRHRGDISTWSKRCTPAENTKEPAVVFSVRFSPSELDGIRKQADDLGLTVASVIRGAVLEHSACQSVVYNFAGGSNPCTMLLSNAVVPRKTSCQWLNQGLAGEFGHFGGFVVPPHGMASAFWVPDEPEDKPHKSLPMLPIQ
ncbi:MAG: hypothetical protein WCE23_11395 [Candidatus Binatus sp.]|uniref:hypothetical protein n=1 Tax=Candidatus Binatus sp. TaxID=2811406 RepID=UPI003C766AA9